MLINYAAQHFGIGPGHDLYSSLENQFPAEVFPRKSKSSVARNLQGFLLTPCDSLFDCCSKRQDSDRRRGGGSSVTKNSRPNVFATLIAADTTSKPLQVLPAAPLHMHKFQPVTPNDKQEPVITAIHTRRQRVQISVPNRATSRTISRGAETP